MQLKARHNFLTLLAYKRVNTEWHTVLNSTTQTGQDPVLREGGRGRRRPKARLAMSLSRMSERPVIYCPLKPASSGLSRQNSPPSTGASLSPSPVPDASLLLANQAQYIHLVANSGHLYHLHTEISLPNLTVLPLLSSH